MSAIDIYKKLDLATTPFAEAMRNNYEGEITRLNIILEKARDALESCAHHRDSGRCGTADHYNFDQDLVREALEELSK